MKAGTTIRILGCGTSSGVPVLSCTCSTCSSKDSRNNRTRASVLIEVKNRVFLIDTTPDLRMQCLRNKVHWIDAVLYTHPHADHLHGIDDLRSLNFIMARAIPCFGSAWSINTIRSRFDYIFRQTQKAGGKPVLNLHLIKKPKKIKGVQVIPLPIVHGSIEVLGYRINNIAYITDCSYIPPRTLKALKNLDVLVLDCLRFKPHPTHLHLESAVELARIIGAKRTFFTHMGHELEYNSLAKSLPARMYPAYDGLQIRSLK